MSREDLHFRLRIPENLKKQVEAASTENKRSMTAEIIHRLEQSFAKKPSIEEMDAANKRLIDVMKQADKRIEMLSEQNTLALQVEMNRRGPEDSKK